MHRDPRHPMFHTELLRDEEAIDCILRSVAAAHHSARARDGQGHEWAVRLLGADEQARILFWRPEDLRQAAASPSGAQLMGGRLPVDLLIEAGSEGRLQFQAGRPMVLHFADESVAMASDFPALLQRETPLPATH